MKSVALLAAILAKAFSSLAAPALPENFSPHFSTDTRVIWQAPTNRLPKNLWIYKKLSPHIFPQAVISNAIVLASFQSRGVPKPGTHDICIMADPDTSYPSGRVCNFYVGPASAVLSFYSPAQTRSTSHIPGNEAIVKWAWNDALQLGIEPTQVAQKCFTLHFNLDANDNELTNQICGRGVFLSRQLDGILFMGTGDYGYNEGFWIEFGSYGQINAFSLNWPDLQRDKICQTASPDQIIACIQSHKIIVLPNRGEDTYFQRVKALANARTFTVAKVTPCYIEGRYGETPKENNPPVWVTPIAELEAVADFGNSNATVRMFSPLLSSDAAKLLVK